MFSLQSWLGESEDARNTSATPGYFNVGMGRKLRSESRPSEAKACGRQRGQAGNERWLTWSRNITVVSLITCYLPLFLPPQPGFNRAATGTEAPAPVPPA